MRCLARLVIAAAVTGSLVASLAGAADDTGEIARRSFAVSGRAALTVDSDLGAIEVVTADAPSIVVVVAYDGRDVSRRALDRFLEQFKVDFEQRGDSVTVTGRRPKGTGGLFTWHENPHVTFRITLPKRADVDLATGGGSISVDGLDGKARVRTSGGSLSIGRVTGPVWGRTSGGSIALTASNGDADLETSGGGIRIGDVGGNVRADTSGGSIEIERAAGTVTAHTSGGSIHVEASTGAVDATTSGGSVEASITGQPKGDCRLSTSGGSVTVRLAATVAVEIDARGNRVKCDLPVTVSGAIERGRLKGTINGGGPLLELHTSGGTIRIEKL